MGEKITNDKCLVCHQEIKVRMNQKKGYHASLKVTGQSCVTCHSEHHGRSFQIVHFEKKTFDHALTGYKLEGAHSKKECTECHQPDFIADPAIKKNKSTYLGLNTGCLNCHKDYHQKTLSDACRNCHTMDAFKPASLFNHTKAKFQLKGKHSQVLCSKCHLTNAPNGQLTGQFTGLRFQSCVDCHKDIHNNQFGQNCVQCHTEESFKTIRNPGAFDHNKTAFPLKGKHSPLSCKSCHKTSLIAPVPHDNCRDCHRDYHKGQFSQTNPQSDCSQCHTQDGFTPTLFSIEKHNQTKFPLEGGHASTPCFECHKKEKDWSFRNIGINCVDCHANIHKGEIKESYFPQQDCQKCHLISSWSEVQFNHQLTSFTLEGKHRSLSCRACHFEDKKDGTITQKFASLKNISCEGCHRDVHHGQFKENNQTLCLKCHGFENWQASKFNHDNTRFKLEGAHKGLACHKCHKEIKENNTNYTNYHFKDIQCINCHLR
jgi:nitrate/TMAO reductase-like tetraheme cytochrome c subunit